MQIISKKGRLFLATAVLTAGIFLLSAWIFQAKILKFLALKIVAPFSDKASIEEISGNALSGFSIKNLYFGGKDVQINIPSSEVRPLWRSLLKDAGFLEITAEKPLIKLSSPGKTGRPGRINTSLLLNLPIKNADISGAAIEYLDAGGRIYGLKNTGIEISLKTNAAIIKSFQTEYAGFALSGQGNCAETGCLLTGQILPANSEKPMSADFSAEVSNAGIKISGNAHIYEGTADFSCRFLPSERWKTELDFTGLKTEKILKKLKPFGALTGRIAVEGAGFSAQTAKAKGLFKAETSGGLKIKSGIEISGGSVFSEMDVSGKQMLFKANSSYRIKDKFLAAEMSSRGKITADDKISGGLTISSYAFTADISGEPDQMEAKLKAEMTDIEMNGIRAEKFMFIIQGKPAFHSVKTKVQTYGRNYELNGAGILTKNSWTVEFTELAESVYGGINLQQPFTLAVSRDGAEISGFDLSRGVESYKADLKYHDGQMEELHFNAMNADISPLNSLIPSGIDIQGRFNADMQFVRGAGKLIFSSHELLVNGVKTGKISAVTDFSDRNISSKDILIETPGGNLKAGFEMAFVRSWKEIKDYGITIVSSNTDISFLRYLAPYLGTEQIFLNSDLKIISDKDGFSITGGANISCPKIKLSSLGLGFDNVNVNLESGPDGIQASGNGGNRKTSLTLKGILKASGPELEFRISNAGFGIPEWLAGTAEKADIFLRGTWRAPEFTGAIKLSRLEFFQEKYDETSKAVKTTHPGSDSMNITARLERNAWYRGGTGSIEAMGQVILKKNPNEPIRLLGEAESIRGYYSYLGKNFDVKSAKISFTGQIPEDPKIYLLASYDDKPNSVVINFEAEGTAKYLKSRLSSEPSMEQRDIISLLVTGQPLYKLYETKDATESGDKTSANLAAQQMLTGYLSAKAGGKVMEALELDVLSMKLTQERKPDITVGRYLTPDLFISYGQTLGPKGEKRINAEYSISKRFSLEGKNSSEGRYSADFLFKFGFR